MGAEHAGRMGKGWGSNEEDLQPESPNFRTHVAHTLHTHVTHVAKVYDRGLSFRNDCLFCYLILLRKLFCYLVLLRFYLVILL